MSIDINDLKRIGIQNPINKWVKIDGIGDNESFIGVVRDYSVTIGESVVEISGASIEIILSDRTIAAISTSSRPAGTIATQVLRNTLGGDSIPIVDTRIDESSLPITWDSPSSSLFDAIQSVAQASGFEWYLDYDGWSGFTFVFQKRIGSDRSRQAIMYESAQIFEGSFSYTIEGMANSIVASGTRSLDGNRPITVVVNDWESIESYGRISSRKDYYGMLSKASLYSAARKDLDEMSRPLSGISFTCSVNDWKSQNVRLGDTISLVVSGMPRIIPCRITAYSIDSNGTVDITAEEETSASIAGVI